MAQDPNVNDSGLVTRSGPTSKTVLYYLKNLLSALSGGTIAAPNSNVLTIQGITGGTPVPIVGSLLTTSLYTQGNVSFSSSGENVVVAGVSAQKVRVFALALTFASPVDATIKDAASGNTLGVFQGVTSLVLDEFSNGSPRYISATAGAFVISLSSAVACKGSIWYTQA